MEGRRREEERLMIQNLTDCSFTKVCIDSGTAESVCPVDAFPSYELKKSPKTKGDLHSCGRTVVGKRGEKAALL